MIKPLARHKADAPGDGLELFVPSAQQARAPGAELVRRGVTDVDIPSRLAWHPTDRQEAYARSCLDPRTPPTLSARASAAGVSRQSVYKWIRAPEFRAWLSTLRRLAFEHAIDDVKARCVELALAGNPEHVRIVLELAGELRGRGMSNAFDEVNRREVNLILGVPRPPRAQLEPAERLGTMNITPAVLMPPRSDQEH